MLYVVRVTNIYMKNIELNFIFHLSPKTNLFVYGVACLVTPVLVRSLSQHYVVSTWMGDRLKIQIVM
jgi:hypothetical protein